MVIARNAAWTLVAGCAAAATLLMGVPLAGAEPSAEECQQQQGTPPPEGEQQQCQDQGPGMPDIPDLPQNQDQDGQQNRLSDTNCWMYPEGPEWFPPGSAPRPIMAGSPPVYPCYYALGLQPTLPGT